MKSKKKLILIGCTAVVSLSTVVVVSFKNNTPNEEAASLLSQSPSVLEKSKSGKKVKTFTSQDIKIVYEAIKENKIAPFEEYIKEGGSLNEVIHEGKTKITLAQAIVKHERLDFIKKAAEVAVNQTQLQVSEYQYEAREVKAGNAVPVLADVATQLLKSSTSTSLAPVIQAIASSPNAKFKKDVLGLSKSSPEMVKAVEAAATTVLPEVVSTCDQDQISYLGDLGADPMASNNDGKNALSTAGKSKCFKAISYWKKEQNFDFDKKDENGVSGFDVLAKFKDPELQSFTDKLQDETVREISSLKPKEKRVSFYKKRVPSAIIDPEALVEPELRPDAATETAEFSEFSD